VGGRVAGTELAWAEPALAQTTTLQLATGVINIWTAAPERAAQSFHRIDNAYPGRFVLGVGVGGPEANADYRKPIDALNAYLDKLDEYGYRRAGASWPQWVRRCSSFRPAAAPVHTRI